MTGNESPNDAMLTLGTALLQEFATPGVEQERMARHEVWGSEADISYPGSWRTLWRRRRVTLLATHDGRVVVIKGNGTRVLLP
jgi:hypothetical protein